jgi:hypothetical protein
LLVFIPFGMFTLFAVMLLAAAMAAMAVEDFVRNSNKVIWRRKK